MTKASIVRPLFSISPISAWPVSRWARPHWIMLCLALSLNACGGTPKPEAAATTPKSDKVAAIPEHPFPDSEKLIGMTASEVWALLGEPGLMRRDPPAELWQYRDRRCTLNFYLYPPENGGPGPQVEYVALSNNDQGWTKSDCLYSLLTGVAPDTPGS